jgi:hypothetical protein
MIFALKKLHQFILKHDKNRTAEQSHITIGVIKLDKQENKKKANQCE